MHFFEGFRPLRLVMAMVGLGGALSAAPFTNGSFETSPIDPGPLYVTLPSGDPNITGWQILFGSVDFISGQWINSHGQRSVDLNGVSIGALRQVFDTIPGQIYELAFDLAGNPGGGPQIKSVEVDIGGLINTFTFDTAGRTFTDMGWRREVILFTAVSSTTSLTFTSLSGVVPDTCCWGAVIDNVTVDAIPEPSTALLLLAGGALFLLRRPGVIGRKGLSLS